jgi:hypothetical protein
VIVELAIRQTDSRLADTQPVAIWIPHLLSFSTPGHARQVCAVEAKLGLSFL